MDRLEPSSLALHVEELVVPDALPVAAAAVDALHRAVEVAGRRNELPQRVAVSRVHARVDAEAARQRRRVGAERLLFGELDRGRGDALVVLARVGRVFQSMAVRAVRGHRRARQLVVDGVEGFAGPARLASAGNAAAGQALAGRADVDARGDELGEAVRRLKVVDGDPGVLALGASQVVDSRVALPCLRVLVVTGIGNRQRLRERAETCRRSV